MSDVKIEHKETMSRDEAAAWLSLLSKALAADGDVDLQLGQSEIQVHVPDQLAAEFEVEVEGDAKWPENEISQTFPKGAWDTGDLSYARPLQLDSPSPHWDGKPR